MTGLTAAGAPAAAQDGELGVPGQPRLVEPEHDAVRIEGLLRAKEDRTPASTLVLVSLDGRAYEIVDEEAIRMLQPYVGERLAVEGTVQPVPDGRDELAVESVRFRRR